MADAFDRKNRKSQSEVKQALQPESKKYGRCAYCETKLQFANFYVDHTQPANNITLNPTATYCTLQLMF